MPIRIFILLLAISLFGGCAQKKNVSSTNESGTSVSVDSNNNKDLVIYEKFDDMVSLFEHENDSTYIINFWATWCKPCVEELPYFDQLYTEFKDQKVKIVLVSLDFPKQIESKLVPFIEKNNLLPEVVVLKDPDANSWIGRVSDEWDGAIPITLIYNKSRRLFLSGEVEEYADLKDKVESLVLN